MGHDDMWAFKAVVLGYQQTPGCSVAWHTSGEELVVQLHTHVHKLPKVDTHPHMCHGEESK